MKRQMESEEHHQVRVLHELCSLIINSVKFPPLPYPFPTSYPCSSRRQVWWITFARSQDSRAALASLFLGMSLSLMLVGSVTFLVGLLLLPWVTLLLLLSYVAALLSNLFVLGRSILGSIALQRDLPYEAITCS